MYKSTRLTQIKRGTSLKQTLSIWGRMNCSRKVLSCSPNAPNAFTSPLKQDKNHFNQKSKSYQQTTIPIEGRTKSADAYVAHQLTTKSKPTRSTFGDLSPIACNLAPPPTLCPQNLMPSPKAFTLQSSTLRPKLNKKAISIPILKAALGGERAYPKGKDKENFIDTLKLTDKL